MASLTEAGRIDPSSDPQYALMIRGELYTAFRPTLTAVRAECSVLCNQYNTTAISLSRLERANLMRRILNLPPLPASATPEQLVAEPWIEPPFRADYGLHVTIGEGAMINSNCTILDTCRVTIGARTLVGPNVGFFGGGHPLDGSVRQGFQGPEFGKDIEVGEDCWFGGNAIVLPGVKIGRGSVVGAGAVVTRDVPAFTVVVGNPARVVKRLEGAEPGPLGKGKPQKAEEGATKEKEDPAALLKRLDELEEEMKQIREKLKAVTLEH